MKHIILPALFAAYMLAPGAANAATPVCNGSNDTAAINAAVAQAHSNNEPLELPNGTCAFNDTIVLTKPVPIIGKANSVLAYCGSGNAVYVNIPGYVRNHVMRDFSIVPCTEGGGISGLKIKPALPDSFYAYYKISNITIGNFGYYGLHLDGSGTNASPFFNGMIHDSFVTNGMIADKLGDSVAFNNVVFHGRRNVTVTSIPDARLIQFIGGQITTSDGLLVMRDLAGARIENVWFEHPQYAWNPPSPNMTAILMMNVTNTTFRGNVINGFAQANKFAQIVALIASTNIQFLENEFVNTGTAATIYANGTSSYIRQCGNLFMFGAPTFVYQGSPSSWPCTAP